jgi:hypothetical protein
MARPRRRIGGVLRGQCAPVAAVVAAGAVVFGLWLVTAATATASSSCTTDPKQNTKIVEASSAVVNWLNPSGDLRSLMVDYQLAYSTTCRTAWAVGLGGASLPPRLNANVFVYNRDTGQEPSSVFLSNILGIERVATDTVNDNGTESHACLTWVSQPDGDPVVCTPYF